MPTMNVDMILKKAEEKIPNPDIIVDPFDLTFVWVSKRYCELTGYHEAELIDKQIFFTSTQEEEKARKMETDMLSEKSRKKMQIPIKTKSGKVLIAEVEDTIINFENHPYMAGRLIRIIKD